MLPCIAIQSVPSSLTETQALAAQHLLDGELALLSPRATSKRFAEFVAGRIAARTAVRQLLSDSAQLPFSILREGNGPTGCPKVVLSDPQATPPHVSISHADGVAIAAAAFDRVGIDLVTIQSQSPSFIDETFDWRELEGWATWLQSEPASALTVTTAFAAKEAALKWLGAGFGIPLRGIEVAPDNTRAEERTDFRASTRHLCIAVARPNEPSWNLSSRYAQWDGRVAVALGSWSCRGRSVS